MSLLVLLSVLGLAQSSTTVRQLGDGDKSSPGAHVAMSKDGSKLVYGVNGGSAYTSSDSGANWDMTTGMMFSLAGWQGVAISPDGTKIALAAMKNGILMGSEDFGASWQDADLPLSFDWVDIDVTNDNWVTAVAENGAIASSINGVMGPFFLHNYSSMQLRFSTVVTSPDFTYIVALADRWGNGLGSIYISTDGGQTFPQSNSSEAVNASELWDFAMSADARIQAVVTKYHGNYLIILM